MPPKVRQLEADLAHAGFANRGGKGSHRNWVHPRSGAVVTVCGKSGDDAPRYLEKQVKKAIQDHENEA
jgi:predicted RNA binding protein YcfA (HicA-like mRNA interferase family)